MPLTISSVTVPVVTTPALADEPRVTPAIISRAPPAQNKNEQAAGQIAPGSKRCLRSAKVTEQRLEIIALNDFKPLQSSAGLTLAGELFDLRIVERDTDLESLNNIINELQQGSADAYNAAKSQYDSALVATQSDIALLKLLILLNKYATHTGRYSDFINEYALPDNLDMLFVGATTRQILNGISRISSPPLSPVQNKATVQLAQLLSTLNSCIYGISPYGSLAIPTTVSERDIIVTRNHVAKTANKEFLYDTAYISRDLTFSREMTRIKNEEDANEDFVELVSKVLGNSFATSGKDQSSDFVPKLTGISAYSDMLTGGFDRQTSTRKSNVEQFLARSGVAGKIVPKPGLLIPESKDISLNGYTYQTIEPLVDEAFSGEKMLDFSSYSAAIDELVGSINDLTMFNKTAFRILDSASESDGSPRDSIPAVAEDQPLSMLSTAAAVYEIFNRRWVSNVETFLTQPFSDWRTPEHVNYCRVMAWIIICKEPRIAKSIFERFLQDYDAGFLTALSVPEPIEGTADVDPETGDEIAGTEQYTQLVNVKPGTETAVNLVGRTPRLNGGIWKINNWFSSRDDNTATRGGWRVISGVKGDASFPEIKSSLGDPLKVNREGAFGTTTASDPDDLRLVTCIFTDRQRQNTDTNTTTETSTHLSSKIITAEIIDVIIECLRAFVEPYAEVAPVEDGDPVFPFVPEFSNPYGDGTWCFSGVGYDSFRMDLWISTIQQWRNIFTRPGSKNTYFRKREVLHHGYRVVEMLSRLMQPYGFLKVLVDSRQAQVGVLRKTPTPAGAAGVYDRLGPTVACVAVDDTHFNMSAVRENPSIAYFQDMAEAFTVFLESEYADMRGDLVAKLSQKESTDQRALQTIDAECNSYLQLLEFAKQEDLIFSFINDFLEKYAERVDNYKEATLGLVQNEEGPLGELITNLKAAGDAGTDVLQSLSVNQMALKEINLVEEEGDVDNAYLPKYSIINESEINSVKVLCTEPQVKEPEANTTKTVIVGLPNGIFDKLGIADDFNLRVAYTDIEYPQLVFRTKNYRFNKDLYVLSDDLESAQISSSQSFQDVVENMSFSRVRVEVVESTDTTAEIELVDDINKVSYDSDSPDIYKNLAASEILKLYYRLMIGLNFSEAGFPSTADGISLPISEAAKSLSSALASNIETISSFSSGLSNNINTLLEDITVLDDPDSFVSGEISPVDAALLVDLKNAYQSRLFSPDVMRSNVIGAKMFDRVYAVAVDPDEFYVVAPGTAEIEGVETPETIFDFYLNAGIIEETGLEQPYSYKLAPRRTAEGSMAFGSVTVSVTTVNDSSERIFDL